MVEQLIPRPQFSQINVDDIEAQLDTLLVSCREAIKALASHDSPSWETVVQPQSEAHNQLSLFWSPISHLNSVMNSEALRDVHKRCLPKLSAYYTELGQNSELYNTVVRLKTDQQFSSLTNEQQRQIENDLRDFQLSGVSLSDEAKKRFGEIELALSTLTTEFSDNVLDATNHWQKLVESKELLAGLPESTIAAAAEKAESKGMSGYLLNLEFPCYLAVMTFAHDRTLRKEMYTAFCTRASDQGPSAGQFDNSERMQKILQLRAEKAALLGYESYAHLSMVPKMVSDPSEVINFLNDLADKALPQAKQEYSQLKEFAQQSLEISELQPWDVTYASDHLKKAMHNISDEELKPYFPASTVIPGMFTVVSRLFGLTITEVTDVDIYHPDVKLYAISDSNGNLRGEFYLDTYARENKRGGAWMDVCSTRQRVGQQLQYPIAYLTCNLTPPVGGDPALLTHNEVTTLFHEFGHGLHHMLTQVETAGVSGINGVEWDAVELPSQFLENWCWERESIDLISKHYKTSEPLPDELLERLKNAKNFQSAMFLVRQLEFALFDMHVHLQATSQDTVDVQAVLDKVRTAVAVVPVPSFNRFQHSFSHIFSGGYSAGYFSYKWAEVLSADAYSRFEEEGIFNSDTGRSFMENVLEVGGSRDAMTSFKAFRGREPSIEPLLKQTGLAA